MEAAILGQIPVIPLQPHPVPVSRQGGGGVVHGAANLPQGQAAGQNRAHPPDEAHGEGGQLQLPLHGSGRPCPPPQHRPCCQGRSRKNAAGGVLLRRAHVRQRGCECAPGCLFGEEKPVLCYLEKKAVAAAGWSREIPLHGFKTIPSHSLHAEAKKTKLALCSALSARSPNLHSERKPTLKQLSVLKSQRRMPPGDTSSYKSGITLQQEADGFRLNQFYGSISVS